MCVCVFCCATFLSSGWVALSCSVNELDFFFYGIFLQHSISYPIVMEQSLVSVVREALLTRLWHLFLNVAISPLLADLILLPLAELPFCDITFFCCLTFFLWCPTFFFFLWSNLHFHMHLFIAAGTWCVVAMYTFPGSYSFLSFCCNHQHSIYK